ncbi:MAG: hypothetical protein IT258_13930 [Saprospiraceae bacterium]|nr:hypothetical protein [Saprospiraceae bacterium]
MKKIDLGVLAFNGEKWFKTTSGRFAFAASKALILQGKSSAFFKISLSKAPKVGLMVFNCL